MNPVLEYNPDALLDVCIPCYSPSEKLTNTLNSLSETADLPYNLIVNIEEQSVVKNRKACLSWARTKYILWLDDDVEFITNDWMSKLYNQISADWKIGVIGVRLLKKELMHNSQKRPNGEVSDVCGAVMMTRLIKDVEFDEEFTGGYYEDTDYCFTVRAAGYKVIQDNSIEVIHINEDLYKGNKHNEELFARKWLR